MPRTNTSKRNFNPLILPAVGLFSFAALVGCNDSSAEDAGEEVDEAVEEVGDEIEDATDG